MEDEDLQQLLVGSRDYNQRHEITGLLIYTGARFIQLLEGDRAEVLKLYQRIVQDPRHHSVVRVFESSNSERCFHGWSMAYQAMDDEAAPFHGLADAELHAVQRESPGLVLGLLRRLAKS